MLIYIIAIPAIVYVLMLIGAKFPVSERVSGGATYKEMLGEFGMIGAGIAMFLILKAVGVDVRFFGFDRLHRACDFSCRLWSLLPVARSTADDFPVLDHDAAGDNRVGHRRCDLGHHGRTDDCCWLQLVVGVDLHLSDHDGFAILCWSCGQGADTAGLARNLCHFGDCWSVLPVVYADVRNDFCCRNVVRYRQDLFLADDVGCGRRAVSQGGALTLNAIAGIGMLTVGIVGGPLIGNMQENSAKVALEAKKPGVYESVSSEDKYILGQYTAVNAGKVAALPEAEKEEVETIVKNAKQSALANVAIFRRLCSLATFS